MTLLNVGTSSDLAPASVARLARGAADRLVYCAHPRLVASERLYDQQGPERLFLETCGGPWVESARTFKDISVVLATPVGPAAA